MTLLRNLAILLGFILPVAIASGWLTYGLLREPVGRIPVSSFVSWWLILTIPASLVAILHTVMLIRFPRSHRKRINVAVSIATAGVCASAMLLFGSRDSAFEPEFLIPWLVAVTLYGASTAQHR